MIEVTIRFILISIFFILYSVCNEAVSASESKELWEKFKLQYGKSYGTSDEDLKRFEIETF